MLTFEQKCAYIASIDLKIKNAQMMMESHLIKITELHPADRRATEEYFLDYIALEGYIRSLEMMRSAAGE
jgi:hypothetical protein